MVEKAMPELPRKLQLEDDDGWACYPKEDHWLLIEWIDDLTDDLEIMKAVCSED